jgi:hypothetical protein
MARITIENLISSVVSKLREKRKASITSVTQSGNEYTLNTAKTFDIKKGQFIEVLGASVYVLEVSENVFIKVESTTDLTTASEWQSLQPYFYYGDPVDMNNEINAGGADMDAKYPAVIMFEVQRERFYKDKSVLYDSESSLRLFFMDQANYEDSSINELYSVVDRMKELSIEFINQLDITKGVYIQDSEYLVTNHSKWGVKLIRDRRTASETLFDNNLTGVELNIDVPLSKTLQLNCNC